MAVTRTRLRYSLDNYWSFWRQMAHGLARLGQDHIPDTVFKATVIAQNSDILALNNTPIVLVPAVKDGIIIPEGVLFDVKGGTVRTGGANTTVVRTPVIPTIPFEWIKQIPAALLWGHATKDTPAYYVAGSTSIQTAFGAFANKHLELSTGTTFAAGGADVEMTVFYRVHILNRGDTR